MTLWAWKQAVSSWMGALVGSWLDLQSQPVVLVLSPRPRKHGNGEPVGSCVNWTAVSIAEAMYSLQFSVKALLSVSEKQ